MHERADPVSRVLDEALRSAALEASAAPHGSPTLDALSQQAFDDLVWLAARLCDAPISLVSLSDGTRSWCAAHHGLATDTLATALDVCHRASTDDGLTVVEDAASDPRTAGVASLAGMPGLRFHAGAPLIDAQGRRYGTLCVMDVKPRGLDADRREALSRLARRAGDALESDRQRRLSEARERAIAPLLEALPDAVVTCGVDGRLREFNTVARDWHGVDVRELPPSAWAQHFDLYEAEGDRLLSTGEIPLARAWRGERVREARMMICARGRPPRLVSCNADPLLDADGRILGAVCVMRDVTRLEAAQQELQVQAQRFAGAFGAAAQGIALVSIEGRWLEVNDALCAMLGLDRAALLRTDFQHLTHPDDLTADLDLMADLLAGRRGAYQMDKRYVHSSGRTIHAHLSVSLVRDAKGQPLHFVSQIQDFTLRHQAEQRLRDSEDRLRTVADNVPALIAHIGADLRYQFANRPYADWFGKTPQELVGRHMSEVLRPEHFKGLLPRLERVLAGETVSFEMDVQGLDGETRHMNASYIPDRREHGSDAVAGFHLMVHDVTPQARLARTLRERAMTDELTGLPNRAAWSAELDRRIASPLGPDTPWAVMFLDLDGFKKINDTRGHAVGDAVLRAFAQRLRASLRRSDFIARLSGDEFVVLLEGVGTVRQEVGQIAQKVLAAMATPLSIDGGDLQVRPSIGIATAEGPEVDAASLMQRADQAMYEVKRSGGSLAYAVR